MKSNVESLSNLERQLNVEVPGTRVTEAFTEAYQALRRKASIKGFRKGKAPLNTIRSLYSDRIKQDVVQDLVQRSYAEALEKHSLHPVNMPDIQFDSIEEDQNFNFSAKFEVHPDVVLKQIEGLKVKKEKLNLSDTRVQEVIEKILQNKAELEPIIEDRGVRKGDTAVINFEGFVEGQPLEGGKGENHPLEIGSNSFIAGFEEGLIDMKKGDEKSLSLKFPDEYHSSDIAGKNVDFKVKICDIKKKIIPELTDSFAKTLGKCDSVEDFKKMIKENLKRDEENRIDEALHESLVKSLIAANPVDAPESLVTEQKKLMLQEFQERMSAQGVDPQAFAENNEQWEKEFEGKAMKVIQFTLLTNKISEEQNIKIAQGDIEKKLQELAEQSNIQLSHVKDFYNKPERQKRLSHQLIEKKVVDFLLSKAHITEVEASELKDD